MGKKFIKWVSIPLVAILIASMVFTVLNRVQINTEDGYVSIGLDNVAFAFAEAIAPSAYETQTNLDGTISDIDEDPDSPDANWGDAISDNGNIVAHVSFPTPSGELTTGTDLQEFKVYARRSTSNATPNIRMDLYEDGGLVTSSVLATTNVTSDSGQVFSGTWDAADLGNVTGVDVEAYIFGASTSNSTITLRAGSQSGSGSATTSFVATRPTTVLNDDYVIIITGKDDDAGTFSSPGFTFEQDATSTGNDIRIAIGYHKVTDNSTESDYTITHGDGNEEYEYWIGAFSGIDLTTPEDVAFSGGWTNNQNTGSPVATEITTVTNQAYVFAISYLDNDDTMTNPSSPWNTLHNSGTNNNLLISSQLLPAGATGNATFTDGGSNDDSYTGQFAFRPATTGVSYSSVDIGAVEWNADYATDVNTVTVTATNSTNGWVLNYGAWADKVFYAAGRYWVFYHDVVSTLYRIYYTSSADGSSWNTSQVISTTGCSYGHGFAVAYNGTKMAYVLVNEAATIAYYRQGTPQSDGTITWDAAENTCISSNASLTIYTVGIIYNSSGENWINYTNNDASENTTLVTKSSTTNGTWTTESGFPYTLDTGGGGYASTGIGVALGNEDVYNIYTKEVIALDKLYGKMWNGGNSTWGDEETVSTINSTYSFHTLVASSDNTIHVVFLKNSSDYDLVYVNRDSASGNWSSEVTVETATTNWTYSPLVIDPETDDMYVFWASYPTTDHMYYRKYTSVNGSWGDRVDWFEETSDNINSYLWYGNIEPAILNDRLFVVYLIATSPPYTIRRAMQVIQYSEIGVSPATYDFGVVDASTTPSTNTSAFLVTNNSTVQTDHFIGVTTSTWTGGGEWTHDDTATAGADQAGLKANKEGTWGVGDVIVKYDSPNFITEDQVAETDYSFGLMLIAPTSYSDGAEKEIVVRITATTG